MSKCRIVDLKELGVSKEVFYEIYSMGEEDGRADTLDEALMLCTYSRQLNNEEYGKGFDDGVALVRKRLKQMQKVKVNE